MNTRPHLFDVIVVGGGGSGLAAAVSAAEQGLSVVLLEKRPQLGGSTGIAVGSFTANRTRHQQAQGIEDSPAAHNEDAGKFAPAEFEARGNYPLREFFLTHGADTLAWLMAKGLAFHGPSPEPPNRVPRMHNVVPNAKAYIAILQADLLRRGGTIQCGADVQQLSVNNGMVTGVVAEIDGQHKQFTARRGVVLAAGDYASNAQMLSEYKGTQFSSIEGINPYATGDGHLLAQSVGAPLLNMDITYGPELRFLPPSRKPFTQMLPSAGGLAQLMGLFLPLVPRAILNAMVKRLLVTWQHPENALFDDGAILVNAQGERFCNERVWPDREVAISRQPEKICYIVLDERLIARYSAWPHFISTAPEVAYAYVADYLRMRPDVAVEGESLTTVAAKRRLPVANVTRTLAEYNNYAAGNATDPWGRTGDAHPLQQGRTVLLGPVKAYFTTTEGAPAITERFEVLNADGQPIPGLYAAGQNGLGGQILWGHGLHIGWAMTSGRLVGRVLAGK